MKRTTGPRDFDLIGFALLSPGLVFFLYGSEPLGEPTGIVILMFSLVLLAGFIRTATKRGDKELIDLRLFKGKAFSASVIMRSSCPNGISFAGQMLNPGSYLIRACGRSLQCDGLPACASWPWDDVHLPIDGNS